MNEIWKDIKGFEGYFQVSNLGRVKRLKYKPKFRKVLEETILTPFTWQSRYLRVDIQYKEDGIQHRRATYVHNLVAETFLGERPEGYDIDHINGDYLDNRAENLRYVTHGDNMKGHNSLRGRKRSKEFSDKVSKSTKVAMRRPEVYAKLGSGTRGKHRKTTYDDKGNKIIRYVNDN